MYRDETYTATPLLDDGLCVNSPKRKVTRAGANPAGGTETMGTLKRTRFSGQREQQSKNWNRRQLIRRDGMVCGLCQEPITKLSDVTIDHIMPVSKGGTDRLDNLRLAHEFCNRQRGAGFFEEP